MADKGKRADRDPAALLQEQGYRLTPQRIMVLDALRESDGHVSAEEVFAKMHARYPYVNISTVYRTLELLKELRLVTETDLGEGRVRYHYADKGLHHHLICQKCGTTADMAHSDVAPLEQQLRRKYGFRADLRHLAIFGRCRDCKP
ncbi:MAG: Fur family transcriptional regulator [Chloroflexota bacterium]